MREGYNNSIVLLAVVQHFMVYHKSLLVIYKLLYICVSSNEVRLYNTSSATSLLFLAIAALLPLSLHHDREPQSFMYIHHLYSCVAAIVSVMSCVPLHHL